VQLKQTGECFISIPEALFDLDYPGHYLRRIKSLGVTIPCVTGPYTGICCTLTLTSSSVRHSSMLSGGNKYALQDNEGNDPRFTYSVGAIQSIVTSSGQNDSGLFETNLHDERYLPFEGAGVISQWRLELPTEFRQFDYDTISDVVLHMRYTAREGGELLKQQVISEQRSALNEISQNGLAQIFSLRHDFPSEWHRFLSGADANGNHVQKFTLSKNHFPFMFQRQTINVNSIDLFGVLKAGYEVNELPAMTIQQETEPVELKGAEPIGSIVHKVTDACSTAKLDGETNEISWTFTVEKANVQEILEPLEDILVVFNYEVGQC
jgi:hypothetical protein